MPLRSICICTFFNLFASPLHLNYVLSSPVPFVLTFYGYLVPFHLPFIFTFYVSFAEITKDSDKPDKSKQYEQNNNQVGHDTRGGHSDYNGKSPSSGHNHHHHQNSHPNAAKTPKSPHNSHSRNVGNHPDSHSRARNGGTHHPDPRNHPDSNGDDDDEEDADSVISAPAPPYSAATTPYSALEDNDAVTSKRIRDDIPDAELIDYEDDGGDSLADSVPPPRGARDSHSRGIGTDSEAPDDEDYYDESRVRIFIALFDYDPVTMSPNPDAMDEELPFKEGQLIKVRCFVWSFCGHV